MPMIENLRRASQGFLQKILPMLVEEQFQRRYIDYQTKAWLANQLAQYEAWGEQQKKAMEQSLRNALAERLIMTLGKEVEELPYSSQEFIKRGQPIAETYGIPLPAPSPTYPQEATRYQQTFVDLARSLREGTTPADETIRSAAELFGPDTVREYMKQYGKEAGERADRVLREREITVEEKTLPIRGLEAKTQAEKLAFEKEKLPAEQYEAQVEDWLKMVEDIEDHLRQEGVEKEEVDKAEAALFGSGKVPDPLTPELRGKAYTYLGEIRTKLIQRKRLTPGEIRFLQTVRNSWQIKRPEELGGGLISPETEMTELELRNRTLETVADLIKKMTGVSDEDARRLAKEFIMSQIK